MFLLKELVKRGIGEVGEVEIPMEVWNDTILHTFGRTARLPGKTLNPLSTHAKDMLRTMREANHSLFRKSSSRLAPNGWVFVVPRNSNKCSLIFRLVEVNGRMGGRPPIFIFPRWKTWGI